VFWSVREELSQTNRFRRSYYELLRDSLDQFVLQYALIDSYHNFLKKKQPYPFVEKRELKPRARLPVERYKNQNVFLLIFMEETLPAAYKKHVRFFDIKKTPKKSLLAFDRLSLSSKIDRTQKHLESIRFGNLIRRLLSVDYALLIQRDPATQEKNRYNFSHFHIHIDWPIEDAAEDLARSLRYISKDIDEKGKKYAEDTLKKYFEYYGMPFMVGDKSQDAIISAQYLKKIPCITTIYVGSSEARALIRISERGVTKAVLIKLTEIEMARISDENHLALQTFKNNYVVARQGEDGIFIFQATYSFTTHARPPDDGKLREIKPDRYWLTVGGQHILPKPGVRKYPPIPVNQIYS